MMDEDFSVFFNENEFADAVDIEGVSVVGVFDYDELQQLEVEGYTPTFQAAASDLASVNRGDTLTRAGKAYTVLTKRKDASERIETLILEAQ